MPKRDWDPNKRALVALLQSGARIKNLKEVDLSEADLDGVDLSGCDFTEANLEGTTLSGATLRGVRFDRTNLDDTHLQGADLRGSVLSDCNLNSCYIYGSNMEGAIFDGQMMIAETNFTGVKLAGLSTNHDMIAPLEKNSTFPRDVLETIKARFPEK